MWCRQVTPAVKAEVGQILKDKGITWLAPGELLVEAQFTEFQQEARGASLVTNNRPRWCANIETEDIGF